MSLKIAAVLARILEIMFAVGIVGSTVVLVLSGIEDIKTLFGGEDEHHS
ncbi:MAG TPA: hypothetical protein VKR59_20080 [Terriglobales bacterium]|nr:hypothetical protein [Terriglobales bacterium]